MKAYQSYLHFLKRPRNSRPVLADDRRKLKSIWRLLSATLKRLRGSGERLRVTLGDETD
jgi:hypothetical protein